MVGSEIQILNHTQKTENLFLTQISVESTLKIRDLGHPTLDGLRKPARQIHQLWSNQLVFGWLLSRLAWKTSQSQRQCPEIPPGPVE